MNGHPSEHALKETGRDVGRVQAVGVGFHDGYELLCIVDGQVVERLRVGVAKDLGVLNLLRVPKDGVVLGGAHCVSSCRCSSPEWLQVRFVVLHVTDLGDKIPAAGSQLLALIADILTRLNRLVDGSETVDIAMMQPKHGLEGSSGDGAHGAADGTVDSSDGVVRALGLGILFLECLQAFEEQIPHWLVPHEITDL